MGNVIVLEFITLDGVVEDPDGSGSTPGGGWAFRHGPAAVSGDKFELGPLLDTAVMLLGRSTWELFAKIWPGLTDDFSTKMNDIPKLVASRSLTSSAAWQNSLLIEDDLMSTVRRRKLEQDVIITGSISVVHGLIDEGLVDEYRLMVFPTVLGTGRRLFTDHTPLSDLELRSVDQKGDAVLLCYQRAA
jgi:dihydrofolate reductase